MNWKKILLYMCNFLNELLENMIESLCDCLYESLCDCFSREKVFNFDLITI